MPNHLFHAIRTTCQTGAVFIETVDGRVWTAYDMLGQSARIAHVEGTWRSARPGCGAGGESAEALMPYLRPSGAVALPTKPLLNTGYTGGRARLFLQRCKTRRHRRVSNADRLAETVKGCGAVLETLDDHGGAHHGERQGGRRISTM